MRDLYRRYPYPPVEAIEQTGDNFAVLGALEYVRRILWPGRRSLAGLRVLDAGCGTGTTAVQIARDYPDVTVTALDISETSLAIARQRAERQGVGTNLTFKLGRIEDLPDGDAYDYIVSTGVLHHLVDPVKGAERLAALLSPTGGMGVMLYATYGRSSIYMVQDLFRRMAGHAPLTEQVDMARAVLGDLPSCHPFASTNFPDHKWDGDAGLVDLLLHPRDRSYTVPDVLDLIAKSGLRLERFLGAFRYDPALYLRDEATRARVARLPEEERLAIAELLHGAMSKHTFFATRPAYHPPHAPAEGLALMVQRGFRSPLMRWPAEIESRRSGSPGADPVPVGLQVGVEDVPIDPLIRTFEFGGWNLDVVAAFDGQLTAWQVFQRPDIQAVLPGERPEAKLEAFGSFLQELAANEILLFEL